MTDTAKGSGTRARSRRGGADAPELTREIIIQAALDQIDADGLESFSVRTLANRLGVFPTALYWYVPNRNAILAQVVALVQQGLVATRRRRDWRQVLRDLLHGFREVVRAHPNVAPLVATQLVSNTNVDLALVEQLLAALTRAGLSGAALAGAYNTVIAAMVGFTVQEFAPLPREDAEGWQASVRDRLAQINRDDYPTLARNLPLLSNRAFILRWETGAAAPLDQSFEIFVEVVIAGIEKLAAAG